MAFITYKSISSESKIEFIEKKSKFIGYIKPITSEESAIEFIDEIKEKHWDATHNVYAYTLLENQKSRYSDDGEPHGTAGLPVLDVLVKNELLNVVVVVTRYFGGTLLGTGGLVRAYSHAALMAVKSAGVSIFKNCCKFKIICDYNFYGQITRAVFDNDGNIDDTVYTNKTEIFFHIPKEKVENFVKNVEKIMSGNVKIQFIEEKFYKYEKNR